MEMSPNDVQVPMGLISLVQNKYLVKILIICKAASVMFVYLVKLLYPKAIVKPLKTKCTI